MDADLGDALERGRQMIREALTEARAELDELRRRESVLERQIAEAEAALGEPETPVETVDGESLTLHEALVRLLREAGGEGRTPRELADLVNDRGLYQRRDGSPVQANQVQARINNYDRLFDRDGAKVRLREDSPLMRPTPEGVSIFRDDDAGFFAWLANHAEGFIVNTERRPKPNYLVLHRPSCPHFKGEGVHWTKDYIKVCSDHRAGLEQWASDAVGGELTLCGTCFR
jgi:hypothetical protein